MHQLREKLEDDSSRPKYIMTKRGIGYDEVVNWPSTGLSPSSSLSILNMEDMVAFQVSKDSALLFIPNTYFWGKE